MTNIFSENTLAEELYLVTGASSGIGGAVAKLITDLGGRVILAGRDSEKINKIRQELCHPEKHYEEIFDLEDADSVADWVKEIAAKYGVMSGIFHSAGIELVRPIKLTKKPNIEQVLASSLMAAFGILRAGSMKSVFKDGASIVFMSSVAGMRGQAGMTAYSAAKAGIDGLVRSAACEFSARKIRVNSIAAGAIETSMHDRLIQLIGQKSAEDYLNNHLLGFGSVSDIANAAVFLLSAASKWITGTTLVVDGGYSVR